MMAVTQIAAGLVQLGAQSGRLRPASAQISTIIGIARTGRLVTSTALILFLAFFSVVATRPASRADRGSRAASTAARIVTPSGPNPPGQDHPRVVTDHENVGVRHVGHARRYPALIGTAEAIVPRVQSG
jgi:hypothetical protein